MSLYVPRDWAFHSIARVPSSSHLSSLVNGSSTAPMMRGTQPAAAESTIVRPAERSSPKNAGRGNRQK
eukprot:3681145-Pleurochrysis_carterae.AAC.2